jgi:hypothetical protein
MATNVHFSQKVKSEQNLYEDIIIESLKMYGQDVYYIPRDIVSEDRILGDDIQSKFNSSYKVEMYIENIDGFGGEGDLFQKFGVEIRDQATFIVSRKRWSQTTSRYDNEIESDRPREGDLIYLGLSNSIFQIQHVEHEQPFYQISNLPTYKLRCELFEYSGEEIDTGIDAIDDIESLYGYRYDLTLSSAAATTAIIDVGINDSGGIAGLRIADPGFGYSVPPTITVTTNSSGDGAIISSTIDSNTGELTSLTVVNPGLGYTDAEGVVEAPTVETIETGGTVLQTLSDGTIVSGEISYWNEPANILSVVSVGADDGKFHSLTTGRISNDDGGFIGVVENVEEVNQLSENEKNDDFDTNSSDLEFLDFSETNPFGDPR